MDGSVGHIPSVAPKPISRAGNPLKAPRAQHVATVPVAADDRLSRARPGALVDHSGYEPIDDVRGVPRRISAQRDSRPAGRAARYPVRAQRQFICERTPLARAKVFGAVGWEDELLSGGPSKNRRHYRGSCLSGRSGQSGRTLYSDSAVRTAVSAVAAKVTSCPANQSQQDCLSSLHGQLSAAYRPGCRSDGEPSPTAPRRRGHATGGTSGESSAATAALAGRSSSCSSVSSSRSSRSSPVPGSGSTS